MEILRLSANSFQKEFIATTGIDPIGRNITMLSACMAVSAYLFSKKIQLQLLVMKKRPQQEEHTLALL